MIILNPKKSNTKFKDFLENYNDSLNLPYLTCPNCNSSRFIKWGFYQRNIYYVDEIIKYDIIKIQRIRCKDCGKTHAILPFLVVPYKQSLIDVILLSLTNDFKDNIINFDTVFNWKKQFRKFIPFLKTMISNKDNIIDELTKNIKHYYKIFYNRYFKLLMMMKDGIFNMAYF